MLIHEFMAKIGDMKFFGIEELYNKKEKVRDQFDLLKADEKYVYKWFYFFQNCHLNRRLKENMWSYITGIISDDKIEKEYQLYCENKEKISQKAKERQTLSNI